MDETDESSPISPELQRAQEKLKKAGDDWEKASNAGSGFNPKYHRSEIAAAQREVDILSGVPAPDLPESRERQLGMDMPRSLTSETYRFPRRGRKKKGLEFHPDINGTQNEFITQVASGGSTSHLEDKPGVKETLDKLHQSDN